MTVIDEVLATLEGVEAPVIRSVGGAASDDPGASFEVHDPATGRLLAHVEDAGATGIARAVEQGRDAFPAWRAVPARERAALISQVAGKLRDQAERLAMLDALDTGNPLEAMRGDVTKGIRQMGDAAGMALEIRGSTYPLPGLHYTTREPWGVVGRMVTFNHPVMYACARLATALVAGNCVVIKASELAPLGVLAVGEIAASILPAGVVSVVSGGPATGEALVRHPDVRRLTFTGSTATALRIQTAAAASGVVKTVTFELGGKNPILVFPDVDIADAARAIVRGMNYTRVQGQSCGSTSRLIIHRSIADEVLQAAASIASGIRIGLPLEPDTEMGSMITRAARDRSIAVVDRAIAAGAKVVLGNRVPEAAELSGGAFLEPTIVSDVTPGTELADQEIFGPVLSAMTFEDEAEAVDLANRGRYGLTAAVWTRDIDRAFRVVDGLEAGYVWVNDVETRFPALPFGGWRDSGVGVEHGLDEVLSMTRIRSVNVRVG